MTDITVIDSIMGSGKTSYIFDYMNTAYRERTNWDEGTVDNKRFIFITPWLDEVKRVKAACPDLVFIEPEPVSGKKLNHFHDLVQSGRNIATTHQLFSMLNRESQEALSQAGYTLIIDEETECVKEYEINKDDITTLFETGMIYTDQYNRIQWDYEKKPYYDGRFSDIKALCDNGNLIRVDDTFWVWEFPIKFFQMFNEVYILTYLFEGSLLSTYLKANAMPYQMKSVRDSKLMDYTGDDTEIKQKLISLVHLIDDPKLNAIGSSLHGGYSLSKNWYLNDLKHGGNKIAQLRLNLENFYRNRVDGKSSDNMWSVFNSFKDRLKGKRYTKGFTACNLKATNDHINRKNLAYPLNVFIRPRLVQYFKQCNVEPNQDLYALSQLIQWVWRSQIRRGDPITLYIPSKRMRELFKHWLHSSSNVSLKLVA